MHPILLNLGSFSVYTYGFFVALGFLAAIYYVLYILKKKKSEIISQDNFLTLCFYTIITAILGARLLYVIINLKEFASSPLSIFAIWEGGLVYYGGFILAILFVILYSHNKKIPVLKFADILVPAIALGHFFGRIGCFFAGCCFGKACDLPWSVVFNNPDSLAVKGVPLHPVQLYESFANFILFIVLHIFNKKQHNAGMTFAFYLIGYALIRFVIEFFRGDFRGDYIIGLSISQVISAIIFLAGILIIYMVNKNARKS